MAGLGRGDNVVITDLGYPTGSYPFLPWRGKGVEIRSVRHRNGDITTGDFEDAVDDHTKIVSLSHVEWTSGLLHDVKAVTGIAHEHGAVVFDDGYQSQGNVDVRPRDDSVDFYTFGSQSLEQLHLSCETSSQASRGPSSSLASSWSLQNSVTSTMSQNVKIIGEVFAALEENRESKSPYLPILKMH